MLELKKELEPAEILDRTISEGITDFYVAYSGGKDSGIVLDIVAKNYPNNFKGVIFVDTGIATDATINFVKEYCNKRKYPLFVLHPETVKRKKDGNGMKEGDEFNYTNLVLKYGFPSAFSHNATMATLKLFPIRQFIGQKIKEGEKPGLISGVRKKESKRRSSNYSNYKDQDGKIIFIKPLFYKSNDWVYRYFMENDIKRSPVYETLHISGDCLCGCFAQKEELKLLEMFHPEVFEKIKKLEKMIKEEGSESSRKYSTWGNSNKTTKDIKSQTVLESYICSDCILDRTVTAKDTEKFNEELEEIDQKCQNLTI